MQFLFDGAADAPATVLLAHGAGAAMDTEFMQIVAAELAAQGLRVARFEFSYMAGRRTGGPKRPPPRVEKLFVEFRAAMAALAPSGPLILAGKSMGGRVASLIAAEDHAAGRIAGVLCLGYPFHPIGKPESLRTDHLAQMPAPMLICQGSRDPFGTAAEVAGYALSPQITVQWLEDGDHDFKTRQKVTPLRQADHLRTTATATRAWLQAQGILA